MEGRSDDPAGIEERGRVPVPWLFPNGVWKKLLHEFVQLPIAQIGDAESAGGWPVERELHEMHC